MICSMTMALKMWVGPNGQRAQSPKDEGARMIVLAFVSREHGKIQEISDVVIDDVNEQQFGKKYAEEEAPIEIMGSSRRKRHMKAEPPILLLFE